MGTTGYGFTGVSIGVSQDLTRAGSWLSAMVTVATGCVSSVTPPPGLLRWMVNCRLDLMVGLSIGATRENFTNSVAVNVSVPFVAN